MVAPWKGSNGSTEDDIRTNLNVRYVETGNLQAVQILLLGHTKTENTVRYLGVDIEDAFTLAERTEI
jgi:hypothetical protein